MAYQARTRDPLFDSETQAALERRARELVGLILIGSGVLIAMILGTYSPDDPSFLSATDAPATNLLGRFGASHGRLGLSHRSPFLSIHPTSERQSDRQCDEDCRGCREAGSKPCWFRLGDWAYGFICV